MSTVVTSTAGEQTKLRQGRPSFFGLVGAEIFKVTRMWSTWITLLMLLGAIGLPYLVTLSVSDIHDRITRDALSFFYNESQISLSVLRVFIGFFLIILTANVFGREYQLGTIRVLLARGVGRLQLLFAKLLAVVLVAAVVFLFCLLLDVVMTYLLVLIKMGNADAFGKLDAAFWDNMRIYGLTVLISMGVTILMAMAVTILGRSLVFGLSAGMAFFPADNLGTVFMSLGYVLTKNDFWNNITAYFLGPNLNAMPPAILPARFTPAVQPESLGQVPLVHVDGTHTLVVALVYGLIFLAVSVILTWKRDVKE